jgi:hypothetical protein
VKQKATRKSEGIATVLARTVNDKTVFSDSRDRSCRSPAAILETIDAAACHQAFKKFWDARAIIWC